MTEGLKFLHDFFMSKKYEMKNLTVTLNETPSFDISSEDYRFRVEIAEVVDEVDIFYRDIAIEDHHKQIKHQKPHLQFKLHADGVGNIYIFLPITEASEYKKYILSFLDIIGNILINADNDKQELQKKFMIMDNFKKIEGMSKHIKQVVYESYKKCELKLLNSNKEEKAIDDKDIQKIKGIPQIAPFFDKI
jgi:hypothetical protein